MESLDREELRAMINSPDVTDFDIAINIMRGSNARLEDIYEFIRSNMSSVKYRCNFSEASITRENNSGLYSQLRSGNVHVYDRTRFSMKNLTKLFD